MTFYCVKYSIIKAHPCGSQRMNKLGDDEPSDCIVQLRLLQSILDLIAFFSSCGVLGWFGLCSLMLRELQWSPLLYLFESTISESSDSSKLKQCPCIFSRLQKCALPSRCVYSYIYAPVITYIGKIIAYLYEYWCMSTCRAQIVVGNSIMSDAADGEFSSQCRCGVETWASLPLACSGKVVMKRPEVSKVIEAVRIVILGLEAVVLDDIFVELSFAAIEAVEIEDLLEMEGTWAWTVVREVLHLCASRRSLVLHLAARGDVTLSDEPPSTRCDVRSGPHPRWSVFMLSGWWVGCGADMLALGVEEVPNPNLSTFDLTLVLEG